MQIQPVTLPYLVPDMPPAEAILPFLQEIDCHRWYTNYGPLVERLRHQILQTHFRDPDVNLLLCSTGTSALELGLLALNLRQGARVLVPAFTFPASANAIQNCGFLPVFCDVDAESWILTPEIAHEVMARMDIDAVMPVAALGRPLPVEQWDQFSLQTGVPVLIDAAPALGVQAVGKHTLVAYSMHATKAFGIGEGGILATQDAELIARAKRISNFGMNEGQVVCTGTNAKLSEYHAAVGLAQIARWPTQQLKRGRIDVIYQASLKPFQHLWSLQSWNDDKTSARQTLISMPIRHNRSTMPVMLRAGVHPPLVELQSQMAAQGIGTRLWYNPGLHRHPHWANGICMPRTGEKELVTVDRLNAHVIGLPFHNHLSPANIRFITDTLRQLVERQEYSASLN